MIRYLCSIAAAVALLACFTAPAWADERIKDFDVEIRVEDDGSLLITERLAVTVEGNQIKRGIFRDFPTLNQARWGLRKTVPFEVVGVKRDGQDENYTVEDVEAGKRIRIGNKDVMLPHGVHTFELVYRTGDQLRFFGGYDELYWNVTGNFWAFPIDVASALVEFPPTVTIKSIEAYTGAAGTKGQHYTANKLTEHSARFQTTRVLHSGEGLTVVVAFQKGVFYKPQSAGLIVSNFKLFLGALIVLLALLWHLVSWWRVGRDPPRGTIIPEFEAPPGFSPAACRYLMRSGFDSKCYSAAVIDLAVKGRVRVEQKAKKDYVLHRAEGADEASEPLEPEESELFDALLKGREQLELKQSNHSTIGGALTGLRSALLKKLEKSHIVRNYGLWVPAFLATLVGLGIAAMNAPGDGAPLFLLLFLAIWSLGVGLLVTRTIQGFRSGAFGTSVVLLVFTVPFVGAWIVVAWLLVATAGPIIVGLLLLAMVLNAVFFILIRAPTKLGRQMLDRIEGLREYLSVAEEDRLNDLNPPEKTPTLFEHFLPYALALDCEQQWSERFASVLSAAGDSAQGQGMTHTPRWYSGHGSLSELGTAGLAAAIGSGMAASLASSAQSPSSSSGSGGGGSSGGGGGGGGGGGW